MAFGDFPNNIAAMHQRELDARIDVLHRAGDRQGVVDLMRKYGLFSDEQAVTDYLAGKDDDA